MRDISRCIFSAIIIAVIACGSTCINPVHERGRKPRLLITADTTISVKDSLLLHARTWAEGGRAVRYRWQVDGRTVFADSDSVCVLCFGTVDTGKRAVTVTGYGGLGVPSDPETVHVTVLLNPPALHMITHDTAIYANDSIVVRVAATDKNGFVARYLWSVDSAGYTVVTDSAWRTTGWGARGGRHVVRAVAMDDDSVLSAPESVLVTVRLTPPALLAQRDTAVAVNDTLGLFVERADTFSTAVRYVWAENGRDFSDTTSAGYFPVVFGRLLAGKRQVLVKAVDSHRLESNVDTVRVTVHLYAPTVSIIHDTAVAINDTIVLRAAASDTNGRIVSYVWALSGKVFPDTTRTGSLPLRFTRADTGTHVIKVMAIDDDTLVSNIDSVKLAVRMKMPPAVRCMGDTAVFINDTVIVHAMGTESVSKSPIVAYVWAKDGGLFDDTTATGALVLRFARSSAGNHTIKVKVVDRDTMESPVDSMVLTVALGAPKVLAMKDTVVFINDTALLHAAGTDTNGRVVAYVWAIDGAANADTTATGMLKKVWGKSGTGIHRVKVIAIDDDTLPSRPDSATVTVLLGMPVVKHLRDTSVVRGDTVVVTISASDTNGTIKKYYWDIGKKGWSDSSDSPSRPITADMHTVLAVVAGARDDDGNIATDTFSVSFSAVACTATVFGPLWRDTLNMYSVDLPLGKAAFSYSARRKDALADSFTYSIACGKSAAELVSRYSGKDTFCTIPAFDTGKSFFRLIAVSSHNDSVQVLDSVFSVWQRQVCFIGHSIVTGLGGTPDSGGFRRIVIDTLRSLCPSKKQLRITGPLISHTLQPPEEDSSLAEVGRKSMDIFDSLFNYPTLAADAWVYMMGVNDQYGWYGWYFTVATIDYMHSRNLNSEIYVLSPIPLPHDTVGGGYTITSEFRANLVSFNHMLDSAVTAKRQSWQARQEGGVWMVDVYSPMALLPDSAYNPVFFYDFIHPDQKGYTLMGNKIVQAIKANTKIFK